MCRILGLGRYQVQSETFTMIAESLGDQGSNLSIMIPTFNCADYLRDALRSVIQLTSETLDLAQIIVVDDCSTQDDPAAVVHEVAGGRVGFHRHSRNQGVCANLNSCLEMAERQWIQILHGDDYLFPDAYREFSGCLEQFPGAITVFARSRLVSAARTVICESEVLGPDERGWLVYDPKTWMRNLIYPGGVLLNRRVIDVVGKFDCTFSHVNDWNYWWRLARTGQCVYTRACVAAYRVSDEGHSSSLVRSGQNVAEGLEQIERLIASLQEDNNSDGITTDDFYEGVYETAFAQCSRFIGEHEAFMANWRWLKQVPKGLRRRKRRELTQLWWDHVRKLIGR
jgi:glycosyltransferase involved in cell wall biosynthesis